MKEGEGTVTKKRGPTRRKRAKRNGYLIRLYARLAIVILCFVLSVSAPTGSGNAGAPVRESARTSVEQATTLTAKKETLRQLLTTAGKLRRANDARQAVLTLNEAGRLQLDLNLKPEALRTFKESQALLDHHADAVTTVNTLNGLASAYVELDQYKKAKPILDQARTISEQNNYPAGKAEALLLLSQCENNDNHADALTTADEALTLWQNIGDNAGVARSHLLIGNYQFAQTNLVDAEQSFQAALDRARALNDPALQAESLVYLSFVAFRKGAWQDMFPLLVAAEALINGQDEPFLMGQITAGLADVFLETGLPEVGLEKYQQALEYFRQTNSQRAMIGMWWGIGKSLYILERYPEALTKLQQSLADAESNELPSWVASSHDYLGRTYAAMNDQTKALEHFSLALDSYLKLRNPMEEARIRALMGQIHEAQGNLDEASALYQQSLKTFDLLNDRVNRSVTLFAIGRLEMKQGHYDSAENYFRDSIETTENIRRMSPSRDLTAAFSATVHDRYEQYIQCLMRRNDKQSAVQAFEISESARARSLAEFLRNTETNLLANIDPELAKREKSLRLLLRRADDERIALLAGKYKKENLDKLDARIAELEAEYKSVYANISERYPAYHQITQPKSWDLARIQNEVVGDDDTILLEYIIGDERSYVWAVTRNNFTSHEIPGEVTKAAAAVYKLIKDPARSGNENELAQATGTLAQMILSPVAAELNKRRIIVISDGALNYIPFQILPSPASDSELMVERHAIVNAPSASILGELREEASARGVRSKVLAAFGNPALSPVSAQRSDDKTTDQVAGAKTDDSPLQYALRDVELNGDTFDPAATGELFYAEREINSLREIVSPAESFAATGATANRDQLFSMDLSQYAILHFATHGLLDPQRPERSRLLLSTVDSHGKALKGFIELGDVYSLRAPVDLVVLSACQTGLGKDLRGEGLVGLTRGFMYAGATSVVASLWKVDDEATAELMKRFYLEMLHNQKTPDEALQIAQNSIRERPEWRAPHYWAGFTLQGEYRYEVNSARGWRKHSTLMLVGAVMILSVGVFGLYRYRVSASKK